jgi:urease accessory protein
MKTSPIAILTGTFFLLPTILHAHPGHNANGFDAGFAHPLLGLDHVLAMFAIGLWAAQLGRRAMWFVPAAVVGAMAVGGLLGMAGWSVPFAESSIALSVLILGVLVTCAMRLPSPVSIILVSAFALCHGNAHGVQMPPGGDALSFGAGFVMATAALHACGLAAGLAMRQLGHEGWIRFAGVAIAITGIGCFFQ